jgi:hypothetical protein
LKENNKFYFKMSDNKNNSMEVDEAETSKAVHVVNEPECKSVIASNASPSITVSLHPLGKYKFNL